MAFSGSGIETELPRETSQFTLLLRHNADISFGLTYKGSCPAKHVYSLQSCDIQMQFPFRAVIFPQVEQPGVQPQTVKVKGTMPPTEQTLKEQTAVPSGIEEYMLEDVSYAAV